jgi:hypothetical protein
MKADVNVTSKRNKQEKFEEKKFKKQDPDPEVSAADTRIRIRTKMSRIHNTANCTSP